MVDGSISSFRLRFGEEAPAAVSASAFWEQISLSNLAEFFLCETRILRPFPTPFSDKIHLLSSCPSRPLSLTNDFVLMPRLLRLWLRFFDNFVNRPHIPGTIGKIFEI